MKFWSWTHKTPTVKTAADMNVVPRRPFPLVVLGKGETVEFTFKSTIDAEHLSDGCFPSIREVLIAQYADRLDELRQAVTLK